MRETVNLGPCPAMEECSGLMHYERKQKELGAWLSQLRRTFGAEPVGARYSIRTVGEVIVVVLVYEYAYEDAVQYASKIERRLPEYWDKQAKVELGIENGNKIIGGGNGS